MTAIRAAIRPAIRSAIRGAFSGQGGGSVWTPLNLFAASEVGVWYDPSDLSTMFQDSAGTTPVTAIGQSVGKILDKSGRANHATQATAAKRPVYQSSGGLHWLQFDGVDDALTTGTIDFSAATGVDVFSGVRKNTNAGTQKILELTPNADASAGAFYLRGESSGASIILAGQHGTTTWSESIYAAVAPANFVASGLFNRLASPYTKVRVNGAETTKATNPGIAAYVNSMLNIGARDGGASLRFNGNIYSLIVRGKTSTTPEIASAESYVAGKTGVTLP